MAENLGNLEGNENENDEVFSSPMDFVTVNRAAKRKKQSSGITPVPLSRISSRSGYGLEEGSGDMFKLFMRQTVTYIIAIFEI